MLIQTKRINIYCELSGTGQPLLLIRGLGSWCGTMRPLSDSLAASYRVISFDNRCVGRSSQPQEPFTIADMADDTAALLDALEIERAHVFGVSLGGMIAQELALRHPSRVIKLALGCTHAGPRTAVRSPDWATKMFVESRDMPRPEALRHSIPLLFAAKTVEDQGQLVEETLAVMANNDQPKSSYLLQLGAVMKHDTFDRLSGIPHHTMVLTGTEDTLIDPANSRTIADRIPHSQLMELPGTGHLFFIEQPLDVSRALIKFFRE
jgi:pimeloyl-ACP methyl ester carboxylesterase